MEISEELSRMKALEAAVGKGPLPEEVSEWRQHPCTLAFLYDLRTRKVEGMQTWARKGLVRDTVQESALANAEALGGMQILQTLIDFLEGAEA